MTPEQAYAAGMRRGYRLVRADLLRGIPPERLIELIDMLEPDVEQ